MSTQVIRLTGPRQREFAHRTIDTLPDGYVVRTGPETRRDEQNRRLHAMIDDLREQVPDMALYSKEDAKMRFMQALGAEMRFLPTLENDGMFPVGLRTSTLTVAQFSLLVELLFKYGAERDVRWSEPMGDRT